MLRLKIFSAAAGISLGLVVSLLYSYVFGGRLDICWNVIFPVLVVVFSLAAYGIGKQITKK